MSCDSKWIDPSYRDGIEGLFFRNPIKFLEKNGVRGLMNKHAYQYIPFSANRSGFDRIICGTNPVLSALIANYYMRKCGERVVLSVANMPGFWGYEFLSEPECYFLIAQMLGCNRDDGPRAVYKALYDSLFLAVSASGSLVVSPALFLGQAVLCDDAEIVSFSNPLRKTGFDLGEAQSYQMSLYKIGYRSLHSAYQHTKLYSGFSCDKYVLTSFDCGYLLPSRPMTGAVGVEYDARFSAIKRVGGAAGIGGSGENYVQRVIADLVAIKRLYETGELGCQDLYLWNQ